MIDTSKNAYLLANTILFAENVCQALTDMTGEKFEVVKETLQRSEFISPHRIIVYTQFYGVLTGEYVVATNETTALKLIQEECDGSDSERRLEVRQMYSGLVKEVLNVAVGRAITELEKVFGNLTHFAPTIIYGEVEFPNVMSANIEIKGPAGSMLCACSLNLANLKISKKLKEAQKKLDMVYESQSAMLIQPDEMPNARFSIFYKSLNEAGGDIYDVIKLSDDAFGYFVADVSGHDIGTGFITASIKALLKQNCGAMFDSLKSMYSINNVLCELLTDFEYVTACYVVINRKLCTMTVINMGHPPILFVPLEGTARLLEGRGEVLGAFTNVSYEKTVLDIAPGDRIFLYTDGLVEGKMDAIWSRGAEKLLAIVPECKIIPLKTMAEELYHKVYSTDKNQSDDIVVLGIEV